MTGPLALFNVLVKKGQLQDDSEQRTATCAPALIQMYQSLLFLFSSRFSEQRFTNCLLCRSGGSWRSSMQSTLEPQKEHLGDCICTLACEVGHKPAQRYGSVGCGKTMSMDIFFSALNSHPSLRVQRPLETSESLHAQRWCQTIAPCLAACSSSLQVLSGSTSMSSCMRFSVCCIASRRRTEKYPLVNRRIASQLLARLNVGGCRLLRVVAV